MRKRVGKTPKKTHKIFWLQVKMLHGDLVCLGKAGEEDKPLTLKQIASFWVEHFMLAIKIGVNKIYKNDHLKQPYKSGA